VASLSAPAGQPADKVAAGAKVYAETCVPCHGPTAAGNPEVGGPSLVNRTWIYGGSYPAIYASVWGGRQGHMPTWETRLTAAERNILALFLVDLRSTAR
jgi:cytochrome c oxidase cbb3-type subunit 3